MPLDRGPSPLRPSIRGTTPSHRRFEAMSPVEDEVHPVIHAGRVAVITGAASGIGKAAAIELAKCVGAVALISCARYSQQVNYRAVDVGHAALSVFILNFVLPPFVNHLGMDRSRVRCSGRV
jgi:hypothetical protein